MRIALTAAAAMLSVSACAAMGPPPMSGPAAAPRAGACNAEAARWAIGQPVDDALVNRVLRETGSRDARVIRPGEVVTMDYREDRVNLDVNERGAITGVRCG